MELSRTRARQRCRQWWEDEERRREQVLAKFSAGEPERQKRERKWTAQEAELASSKEREAKAHARAEEAEGREKQFVELLRGAGIRDGDDLERLLERHVKAGAEEESRSATC